MFQQNKKDMAFFLRYTENIEADIDRGYSYHLTGLEVNHYSVDQAAEYAGCDAEDIEVVNGCYSQKLDGLCAFELDVDNLDDAIKAAKNFSFSNSSYSSEENNWVIVKGVSIGRGCPEGETIVVQEVLYVNSK